MSIHPSGCGVVKRFTLSRVEPRGAQTPCGEPGKKQGNLFGLGKDTPLETHEMRVHVTASHGWQTLVGIIAARGATTARV